VIVTDGVSIWVPSLSAATAETVRKPLGYWAVSQLMMAGIRVIGVPKFCPVSAFPSSKFFPNNHLFIDDKGHKSFTQRFFASLH